MIPTETFGRTGHRSTRTIFGAAAFSDVTQAEADRTMELLLRFGWPVRWSRVDRPFATLTPEISVIGHDPWPSFVAMLDAFIRSASPVIRSDLPAVITSLNAVDVELL